MKARLIAAVMIVCMIFIAGQKCFNYSTNIADDSALRILGSTRYEVAPGMTIAVNTVHQILSEQ